MKALKTTIAVAAILGSFTATAGEAKDGPYIISGLSVHQDKLVFATGGNLWQVARSGGTAKAITQGSSEDTLPLFSPDGSKLAFTRKNQGNADVYTLDVKTGLTTRLTSHPTNDWAVAWSADGNEVNFASGRLNRFAVSLFTIATDKAWPQQLPTTLGNQISYSTKGPAAYVPISHNPVLKEFRYYRGGQQGQIHIVQAPQQSQWQSDSIIRFDKANVHSPKWLGDTLYYLSDKDGVANLYRHSAQNPVQLTQFKRFGIRDFAVDEKGFVIQQNGAIHTMSVDGKQRNKLTLELTQDKRLKQQRRINAALDQTELSLSNDGSQFIMVARGDVFLADEKTRRSENLTKSADSAERSAVMSPDGNFMAYFSDKSGKYQLHIQSLKDKSQVQSYAIEANPGFYLDLNWSPDSKKLSFNDHRLQLWLFDSTKKAFHKLAKSAFSGQNRYYRSWSPDSQLLAYGLLDGHGLSRVYIYDMVNGQSTPLTTKESYANLPQFDKNGRYLYYYASPNANSTGYHWGVLNGLKQLPMRRGTIKAVVLNNEDLPPIMAGLNLPNLKVDFEKIKAKVTIDYQDIEKRTISLDIGSHNVAALNAAAPGKLQILTETHQTPVRITAIPKYHLYQLDLRNPSNLKELLKDFDRMDFSGDGKWAYYTLGRQVYLQDLSKPKQLPKALSSIPLFKTLDPKQEWRQMFNQSYNFMVEQMYDPDLHGIDPQRLYEDFARYLPNIGSRGDLAKLTNRMLGFLSVSHSGAGTGDTGPAQTGREHIGLLGADFAIENNRYRFTKVMRTTASENAPFAPLDQYGARVHDGEYLIAVNNQPIKSDKNLHKYFFGLSGKVVILSIADNPQGHNARKIQVKTIADEESLRLANWADANKRYVEQQSQGKLKYVHIPRFNAAGIEDFLAQYYQLGSAQGLIIDVRFNPGGITSDALIELLTRKTLYKYRFRQGVDLSTPVNAFDGQTTLIINQFNASAAETFAQMFKAAEIGTVVGKPTYGAGIGPYAFGLELVDGAAIRVPNRGSYMPDGKWTIENRGLHPHVDINPYLYSTDPAQDPQLSMAVKMNQQQQQTAEQQQWTQPVYPVHPGTAKAL